MRPAISGALLVLTIFAALFYLYPTGSAANYAVTYQLLDHMGGSPHYRLNVAVSESLFQYYVDKDHRLFTETDFAKFVTSFTLKPISDSLRQIYEDDEEFVNAVLTLVHQITYEATGPPKYPVETIVDGKGDCDLFSYVAASIITAGRLDVVLFYYQTESHMNIGVNLQHDPVAARKNVEYVMHDGRKYYVAECTGEDWQNGWRVGESPDNLEGAQLQVISLENSEQSAPGQVSASYKSLYTSALSLRSSADYLIQGSPITFSGQISPVLQNVNVTVYVKVNGLPWSELGTATTDSSGQFKFVWDAAATGINSVRASWSGNDEYAGTDSPVQTVTVLSLFFVSLLSITIVLVCVGSAIFLLSRRSNREPTGWQPPEVPS